MPVFRSSLPAVVLAVGALAAGCGSGSSRSSGTSATRSVAHPAAPGPGRPPAGPGEQTIPAPAPTGVPADPGAVDVIRAWSNALRRGDVNRAARYFGLPSVYVNGPDAGGGVPVIVIHTEQEAQAINATLPCGAVLLSTDQRGQYVNALFRLTNRPGLGGGCGSGAGQLARTNFVVRGGRIVRWIRAPSDPGDNQRPGSASGPAV